MGYRGPLKQDRHRLIGFMKPVLTETLP